MKKMFVEEEWIEVKEGIRSICKEFPESYWQKLDQQRTYPQEFVNTLTDSGFLATPMLAKALEVAKLAGL